MPARPLPHRLKSWGRSNRFLAVERLSWKRWWRRSSRNKKSPWRGGTEFDFLFRRFVNDLAADHRHRAGRGQDFRFGNFHDVFRENGEIGELAGFEGAFVFFFERSVGGSFRKHFQRLLARDGLL